MSRRFAGEM